MNYKGYELRQGVKTILTKGDETVEVEAWGIYRNGDFRGSAKTLDAAKQFIDGIPQLELHRDEEQAHYCQRTDYDDHGRPIPRKERKQWKTDLTGH